MELDKLREKLAAIEHERWADWQKYVHLVYFRGDLPDFIPRWDTQINTPYAELSDAEKASDMEQVDRYWPLITELIDREVAAARQEGFKAGCEDIINHYHHDPEIRRAVQAATLKATAPSLDKAKK